MSRNQEWWLQRIREDAGEKFAAMSDSQFDDYKRANPGAASKADQLRGKSKPKPTTPQPNSSSAEPQSKSTKALPPADKGGALAKTQSRPQSKSQPVEKVNVKVDDPKPTPTSTPRSTSTPKPKPQSKSSRNLTRHGIRLAKGVNNKVSQKMTPDGGMSKEAGDLKGSDEIRRETRS
tara:strand:+ start:1031 stop:1561 length:531 start_codon:yes stop_codon:yes gene_type:complete